MRKSGSLLIGPSPPGAPKYQDLVDISERPLKKGSILIGEDTPVSHVKLLVKCHSVIEVVGCRDID